MPVLTLLSLKEETEGELESQPPQAAWVQWVIMLGMLSALSTLLQGRIYERGLQHMHKPCVKRVEEKEVIRCLVIYGVKC